MSSDPSVRYQIRKFVLKFLLLLCMVIIADQLTGRILNKFYFSQVAGANYRTTYAMDSTNAEVLIFGSSRANHHYVPEIFEKGLNMSCYNTGMDGNFFLYNYAVFKAILSRYVPKILILDINPGEFYYDPNSYERLSSLLPYYSKHPEIRRIVNLRSPYEKIKLLSAVYPFNSLLTTIGVGNLEANRTRKNDQKGYIPLSGQISKADVQSFKEMKNEMIGSKNPNLFPSVDSNKVKALDSISQLCLTNGINFFICISPIFTNTNGDKINASISDLFSKKSFRYFDFSNASDFILHPELFRDIDHLNNDGAIKYSAQVLDSIKFSMNIN